jgi:putative peptidoglycan lipid II flippase
LNLSSNSTNARIFRAAVIVAMCSGLVAIAAMLRELFVARFFGRSDAIDAFLVAYLLPSSVVTIVAGSLATALLPVFVEVRHKQGVDAAQELFSSVLVLISVALLLIAAVLGLFAPIYLPYLGSGFSAAKLGLTRELLLVLLPLIFFNGIAISITAVLNASERFAFPAIVPLVTPIVVMLWLGLAARRWGAFSLAAGIVSGSVIEAALLASALKSRGLGLSFRWNGFTPAVRAVLGQYTPVLAGSLLIGSTLVVDKAMAAMLSTGSVAALSYANKVVSAVLAITATALSTSTLPYFSKMVALHDWSGCRHTIKRYSSLVAATAIPLTAFLVIFSKPLVTFFFQRGAFSSADTNLVSHVQVFYLIQIPFYLLSILFVRFLSAARRNDVLMYGAAISLLLDIVLNLLMMRKWGVAGIALSTSCVYAASCLYLFANSYRLMSKERVPDLCVPEEQGVAP